MYEYTEDRMNNESFTHLACLQRFQCLCRHFIAKRFGTDRHFICPTQQLTVSNLLRLYLECFFICRILTSRLKIREYKTGHTNNDREAELSKLIFYSTDFNLRKSCFVNLSRAVVCRSKKKRNAIEFVDQSLGPKSRLLNYQYSFNSQFYTICKIFTKKSNKMKQCNIICFIFM